MSGSWSSQSSPPNGSQMSAVPALETFDPKMIARDNDHLRLLVTFHYIAAGLTLAIALLTGFASGVMIWMFSSFGPAAAAAPPAAPAASAGTTGTTGATSPAGTTPGSPPAMAPSSAGVTTGTGSVAPSGTPPPALPPAPATGAGSPSAPAAAPGLSAAGP
ncbi:MAG: hypothetical protein ACREJ2_02695, partial [Planctomycetota bacterium]